MNKMSAILHWVQTNWLASTATIALLITGLSLWPADALPKVPGTDKTHHVIAYCLLMLPVALRSPRYLWAWGLGFVAYSGVIELIQPFVNRYGEWLDLLANASGVLLGLIIGYGCKQLLAYRVR